MEKIFIYEVDFPGDPGAGISSFTDTIRIEVESGDPGGFPGQFEEDMRTNLCEWYDTPGIKFVGVAPTPITQDRAGIEGLVDRIDSLLTSIKNGRKGSMGSIDNAYIPQLDRVQIDELYEQFNEARSALLAAYHDEWTEKPNGDGVYQLLLEHVTIDNEGCCMTVKDSRGGHYNLPLWTAAAAKFRKVEEKS